MTVPPGAAGAAALPAGLADWLASALGAHEPPELVRQRAWSTTWTVRSGPDRLWLKADTSATRHDPALTALVARVAPDHVLTPVAVEAARGWMLTVDGGPTLQETGADRAAWCRLVADWAQVQRGLAGMRREVLAAGCPDLTDAVSVGLDLARTLGALPAGDPRRLADADAVARSLDRLRPDVALLAAGPVPPSLDHGDLHAGNAFTGPPVRVFDLGDAVWAHPFTSLALPLRTLPDPAWATAVRAAYLQGWADTADPDTLDALVDAACRVAAVHRSYGFWNALAPAAPTAGGPHAAKAAGWLREAAGLPDRTAGLRNG